MKRVLITAVLVAMVLPTAAQAGTITATTPFQADVAACNGHTIRLSGQLLGVFTATPNSAGGFMFASHIQPQGISGVDLQTGTKYLGTGLTRDLTVFSPSGTTTLSLVSRFHIQATARADSFDVSQMVHITVLANGAVTAFVDNFSG